MSTATATQSGTQTPQAGAYGIDTSHSSVEATARHLMVSKVRGRFHAFEGEVVVADDPTASSVQVTIDASSIDTGNEDRDQHLRSADFLDVENHPSITYRSTGLRHQDGARWELDGELTLHGVTVEVPLTLTYEGSAQDPWGNHREVFSATTEIDREAFGITWNQALETGGVLVSKTLKVQIEVQAVKQG